MAITIDGVTYRNLPEQVEKNKTDIEALKANIEGIKKNAFTDVDTAEYPTLEDFLQSTGEEGIIYLYPDGTNFKQYIWEGEDWRFIGDTELDISNMMTTDTDQSVGGVKTIETDLAFNQNGINPVTWHIQPNAYNGLDILRFSNPVVSFAASGITAYSNITTYSIIPIVSNIHSLGSAGQKWLNLWLGGKIYNTIFTVNNGASDTFIVDGANGQTKSAYTLLPISTSTADIGSSSLRWRNIYSTEARVFYIGDSSNDLIMKGLVFFPDTNGTKDLGKSTFQWHDLYMSGDIQKAEETIEFICPKATELGLTLTTVATRATILNKTLNITIAFTLANPTEYSVSIGNTLVSFIKLDQSVYSRIKDMNGDTLSTTSTSRVPVIGKALYQTDRGYASEGLISQGTLAMTHNNLEDNVSTTRFRVVPRDVTAVSANTTISIILTIEIPLDL